MKNSDMLRRSQADNMARWYESQHWLRAMVQMVPQAGGAIDTLLAWRGTGLRNTRVDELLANVSQRLSGLEESALNEEFLQSEEFFQVFVACAEAVGRSASEYKRGTIADFLSRTVIDGVLNDLSTQIAEDFKLLQELHLQILSGLPSKAGAPIDRSRPPEKILRMPPEVYMKGIADLERLGFITYNTGGTGLYAGGSGHWETTKYLQAFLHSIRP